MVCLDSNPGPQDDRRRQNHGAMAATPIQDSLRKFGCLVGSNEKHLKLLSLFLKPEIAKDHSPAGCIKHGICFKRNYISHKKGGVSSSP